MVVISRLSGMRDKEVINVKDGTKLGNVDDLEIETDGATVSALVIYGKLRFFGLFGREDDIIVPWDKIKVVGEDTVLVEVDEQPNRHRRRSGMGNVFDLFR